MISHGLSEVEVGNRIRKLPTALVLTLANIRKVSGNCLLLLHSGIFGFNAKFSLATEFQIPNVRVWKNCQAEFRKLWFTIFGQISILGNFWSSIVLRKRALAPLLHMLLASNIDFTEPRNFNARLQLNARSFSCRFDLVSSLFETRLFYCLRGRQN